MKATTRTRPPTTARKPSRNKPGDIRQANAGRTITLNVSALRDTTLQKIRDALFVEKIACTMLGRDSSHLPPEMGRALAAECRERGLSA